MSGLPSHHSIGKQTLVVDLDSREATLALQARLSDINRNRFLPVMERVLDEFDVPGRHFEFSTLHLNLGTLPLGDFEEAAAERLERELRRAIEQALRELDQGAATKHRSRSTEESRLELLEHYLLYGTVPFWATGATFDFHLLFAELAANSPALLAGMIKKLGRQQHVLMRLAFQLSDLLFRRLVHLLEPEHAALIIAYMIDLQQVQRKKPLLEMSEERYTRHLRLLVLTYLVQDRGSQFNRKSFVKSLLEGMAESEGIDYLAIIKALEMGLRLTETKQPLKSSLPAVIRELAREVKGQLSDHGSQHVPRDIPAAPETTTATQRDVGLSPFEPGPGAPSQIDPMTGALSRLEHYLRTGQATDSEHTSRDARGSEQELRRLLTAGQTDRAVQLIRELAARADPGRSTVIRRLLEILTPEELLALLSPRTPLWVTDLIRLVSSTAHPSMAEGVTARSSSERACWEAALQFLLAASHRRQFRELVRCIVESMAGNDRGASLKLLETTIDALNQHSDAVPASMAKALETARRDLDSGSAVAAAKPLFQRYDEVESLRYYLRFGMLPWHALIRDPGLTEQTLLASLPRFPRSLLGTVFVAKSSGARLAALLRVMRLLPTDAIVKLLANLLPKAGPADSPFGQALADTAARVGDLPAFYSRLVAAILDGQSIDLEQLAAGSPLTPTAGGLLPADLADWEPHALQSTICQRLRSVRQADEPTLAQLLDAFIATHRAEARRFLRTLQNTQDWRRSMVRQIPAPQFAHIIDTLFPQESEILQAVERAMSKIPTPYRPRSVDVREAILHGVLRQEVGQPLRAGFFSLVVEELFRGGLAEAARRFLLRESSAWPHVSSEAVANFQAAVTSFSEGSSGAITARRFSSVAAADSAVLRVAPDVSRYSPDAVFAFLLGQSPAFETGYGSTAHSSGRRTEAVADYTLVDALRAMVDESPDELQSFVRRHATERRTRESWAKKLPESALVRLFFLLEPRRYRELLDTAEVLMSAWLETGQPGERSQFGRADYWSLLLEFVTSGEEANRSPERLSAALFAHLGTLPSVTSSGAKDRAATGARLLKSAGHMAQASGRNSLSAILHRNRELLLETWNLSNSGLGTASTDRQTERHRQPSPERSQSSGTQLREPQRKTRFGRNGEKTAQQKTRTLFEQPTKEHSDPIYIDNAGLVLAGTFMPHLFQTLDMLEKNEGGKLRFHDMETASRAVHLLQYLVDGGTSTPEPLLVLNKILCGIPLGAAIVRQIEITDRETETCDLLLKSMIAHWEIIKNTSVAGLRETFMQRDGRLQQAEGAWKLRVQRKTLDVLVDRVPWSINVLRHGWMAQSVYVTW